MWIVIPAMGVVSALAGLAIGSGAPLDPVAAGLAGAAIAAMVRSLVGDSPASLSAAAIAPMLAILVIAERTPALAVPCLALGALAWTIAELARTTTSPFVALLPAAIAAILEPGFVALVPIAGWRLVTSPQQRPPWTIGVPIAGAIATLLAVVAGLSASGVFGSLGTAWFGARQVVSPATLASSAANDLGPLVAVGAIAGLAMLARAHVPGALRSWTSMAIACCLGGLVLADLRGGGASPVLLGLCATGAALAIGRVAATIPLAAGQSIVGATLGFLVVLPPSWTLVERTLA